MIFGSPQSWLVTVESVGLSVESEVVHPGDAEHLVVDNIVLLVDIRSQASVSLRSPPQRVWKVPGRSVRW